MNNNDTNNDEACHCQDDLEINGDTFKKVFLQRNN
jgi:hypothetical protein